MKLSVLQTQKQILAPVLQQSIAILFLPQAELDLAIEQELEDNPLLEGEARLPEEGDFVSNLNKLNSLSNLPIPVNEWEGENNEFDITDKISLIENLTRQLRLEIGDKQRFTIGEFIIGNLDQDGYLSLSLEEMAATLGLDIALIEEVLEIIQNFEPLGIASRNLKECLCIQLKNKRDGADTTPAIRIIEECFEDLLHQKYTQITKKLKISPEEVRQAVQAISSLDPRPGSNFQVSEKNIYVLPDVYVRKDPEGKLKVEINRNASPRLRINALYRNLLEKKSTPEQEKAFIREKLNRAMDFIRSVQQRGSTLLEICNYIIDRQKDFFTGNGAGLVPMTLKDVATKIQRNESTVSRAINGKYMDTHMGLYPLKFFFTQAILNEDKPDISSHTVKEEIQDLIEEEDKNQPLSDQEIQNHFRKKGLKLSRRTVSKYRQDLNIRPSYSRKICA